MAHEFFTLQDFYTFAKGITYIVTLSSLPAITAWYLFVNGRGDEEEE